MTYLHLESKDRIVEQIQSNPGQNYYETEDLFAVPDTEEEKEKWYQKDRVIIDEGVEVNSAKYAIFLR